MHIDVQALTTFNIAADGRTITFQLVDALGSPVELNLQIDQLGMLAMTLPNLIDAAVQRQLGDASFRFTYPMESWRVEQSTDPSTVILTMRTSDGFGVSFSLSRCKAEEMADAIAAGVQKEHELMMH